MKRMFFARSNCSFFMTAIAAGLTAICPLATRAADTKPEEIRQKAAQLQRKAEELKAAGREEEAGKLMREVQELRDQAEGFEPGPREAGRKQRLQELNRELDRLLKSELKELSARGATDQAAQVKGEVSRIGREVDHNRAR